MNDIEILKGKLIRQALKDGICEEGYRVMQTRNLDGLIAYYLANPDWCMERNFPDLQTLTDNFAWCKDKGIYVNHVFHGELLDDLQTYIFHNCKGVIKTRLNLALKIIPMFYFANNCDMLIECDDNISIPLYIFGKNEIAINNTHAFKFFKRPLLVTK